MRLTQFGTYTFPLYNKRDLVSQGDSSGALIRLAGGGVYDGYNSDQAPEATTDLVTSFEIIASTATAVQTQRDAIRALRGTVKHLWAHFPDNTDRWVWARLSKIKMERRREYIFYQPVELTFEIAQPGWYGRAHGAPWYFDDGHFFDEGLYFDTNDVITLTASPKSVTIANAGNRMIDNAVFTITAQTAPITSFRFACSPCDWIYSGTVAVGKSLVVDCGKKSILNDSLDGYADFDLLPAPAGVHAVADWSRLEPGNNSVVFTFAGGGTDSTVTPTFSDGWE